MIRERFTARLYFALLACLFTVLVSAQVRPTMENLTPESIVDYDIAAGIVRGRNGVVLHHEDTRLTATEVDYNHRTSIAQARGTVRIQRGGHLFTGSNVEYN